MRINFAIKAYFILIKLISQNYKYLQKSPFFFSFIVKGTVSAMSSDPLRKDDKVRFAMVPLKASSDQL